ncbi:lymphotoxin-alpha [Chanos chanos]|uniref:Lymphotoxin-alpha n=1 Tax=Chanos chanos TaxID=29144 RepID=A0A6J2W665_CHACN|nr:uncharacterized protein LOC115819512 [Chanos chanos]
MSLQSQPRFHLLLGWCFLLSVAVVTMAVVLVMKTNGPQTKGEVMLGRKNLSKVLQPEVATTQKLKANRSVEKAKAFYGENGYVSAKAVNYTDSCQIHRCDRNSWTEDPSCAVGKCSLLYQNNSVNITTGGLYLFYAQVTFSQDQNTASSRECTVTFLRNTQGTEIRKLSEATQHNKGTLTMFRVFPLVKGDSVTLDISDSSVRYSDEYTYWGLFLLREQDD